MSPGRWGRKINGGVLAGLVCSTLKMLSIVLIAPTIFCRSAAASGLSSAIAWAAAFSSIATNSFLPRLVSERKDSLASFEEDQIRENNFIGWRRETENYYRNDYCEEVLEIERICCGILRMKNPASLLRYQFAGNIRDTHMECTQCFCHNRLTAQRFAEVFHGFTALIITTKDKLIFKEQIGRVERNPWQLQL